MKQGRVSKTRKPSYSGIGKRVAAALLLSLPVTISPSVYAESWEWSLTPYAWLIGTELSTKVDIPADGEQDFENIGEKLDFAGQLHLEAQRGRIGILFDITNLSLSDKETKNGYRVDTDSSTTLIEAALMFKALESDRSSTSLFLGTRILDVDVGLDIRRQAEDTNVVSADSKKTLSDFMLGIRYQYALNDDWTLVGRGDFASGDTDRSWNAVLLLGRKVGDSGQFLFGYRYLKVEFEKADELLDPELIVSGPMIGYSFRF